MSLKSKVKTISIPNKKLFVVVLIAIFSLFTLSVKATDEDFQFHGFVAQGIIDVDGSDFVNVDGSLSLQLTELGINGSYQLSSNFRLATQFVYLNGGNRYKEGVRVDYALLDWSAYESPDWQAHIYLGRFKNNHWLYSSSRDVPFARPSIILPQSVYFDGFRDIAVGSDGTAIKISHSNDDYGDFDFNFSYGTSQVSDKQTDIILSQFAQGTVKQDSDIQGSLYWQPVFSSWRFGASYLDSDFSYRANDKGDLFVDGEFSFQFYTISALFEGEVWEFSGEVYQEKFTSKGFYHPLYSKAPLGQGMYVQSRFKASDKLILLARYESFYSDKKDKDGEQLEQNTGGLVPAYFGYHRDATLGLSYDISSNLRLRLEYHWFQGAGRLTPVVLPNPIANANENWQLWAMQLMYWF